MNDVLVEALIESVKSRTLAPMSQSTFEEPTLIAMLTEELLVKLVSDIKRIREDFFLSTYVVPIVANLDYYPTPPRAIGNSFTSLHYMNENGQIEGHEMTRIDSSRRHEFSSGGNPSKFFIEGDEVVIPKPTSSRGSLLFTYERKPNRLISTSSCAKITAAVIGADFVTFTVDTDLTATVLVGQKVDLLSSRSPFLLWSEDADVLAVSSNQIQIPLRAGVNAAGLIEAKVGDYICPAGYANIPMIPEEQHPVLAQMGAVRVLASLGDQAKWQMAKAELGEVRKETLISMKNRVQSSPKRVSARRNGLLTTFGR